MEIDINCGSSTWNKYPSSALQTLQACWPGVQHAWPSFDLVLAQRDQKAGRTLSSRYVALAAELPGPL